MPDPKLEQSLVSLLRALEKLNAILQRPLEQEDAFLDATIQRFEFVIELTWKTIKRALAREGIEAGTPKEVLRRAYAVAWIDDEAIWLSMLRDRNLTSHLYDEETAREIYERIHRYYPELRRVYAFLRARFQDPVM